VCGGRAAGGVRAASGRHADVVRRAAGWPYGVPRAIGKQRTGGGRRGWRHAADDGAG